MSETREERGRKAYERMTDNHPTIHSNRFPAWGELSSDEQAKWISEATPAPVTEPQETRCVYCNSAKGEADGGCRQNLDENGYGPHNCQQPSPPAPEEPKATDTPWKVTRTHATDGTSGQDRVFTDITDRAGNYIGFIGIDPNVAERIVAAINHESALSARLREAERFLISADVGLHLPDELGGGPCRCSQCNRIKQVRAFLAATTEGSNNGGK